MGLMRGAGSGRKARNGSGTNEWPKRFQIGNVAGQKERFGRKRRQEQVCRMRPIATLGSGERQWCMVHRAIGEVVINASHWLRSVHCIRRDGFETATQMQHNND